MVKILEFAHCLLKYMQEEQRWGSAVPGSADPLRDNEQLFFYALKRLSRENTDGAEPLKYTTKRKLFCFVFMN